MSWSNKLERFHITCQFKLLKNHNCILTDFCKLKLSGDPSFVYVRTKQTMLKISINFSINFSLCQVHSCHWSCLTGDVTGSSFLVKSVYKYKWKSNLSVSYVGINKLL